MYRFIKIPFLVVSTLITLLLADTPLTQTQLHATLGIVTSFILNDTVTHHGKSYSPVTSPHTGRVWLDRNIGASKKCTSYDHALCYGDFFQWGRAYDGHESSIDSTTVLAADINNAGAEFIRGAFDWASTDVNYGNSRATNWLKIDGSSVCPVGYRVPLRSELDAEVGNISNKETAYANFLKFPAAGYRHYSNANYNSVGTLGTVWSVTSTFNRASYFRFYTTSGLADNGFRAWGLSVRCIKHVGKPLVYHNTTTYSTVTSPYTGKVWLDRNLGASQVCTALDDASCYGDYYQWGRGFDGHQDSGSATIATQATDVNSAGSAFITSSTSPFDWASVDSTGATRSANWFSSYGSSVCPVDYRVPTFLELRAELFDTASAQIANNTDAFNSFLKLPSAGGRSNNSGTLFAQSLWGYVWSRSVHNLSAHIVYFNSDSTNTGYNSRAIGFAVRCLRN